MAEDRYPFEAAHAASSKHRAQIAASDICGCFYCCETFPPSAIQEWIDEPCEGGENSTALCPRCGIDSVLGSGSGYPVTEADFLGAMRAFWF